MGRYDCDPAPHTVAKHRILRSYLNAWFPIMANVKGAGTIRYIDGYCGPGLHGDHPGSPVIALQAAIKAQHRNPSKPHIFDFVDKDPKCTKELHKVLKGIELPPWFEVRVHTRDFQHLLPELLRTLQHDHAVFAFLDPFGFDVKPRMVAQLLPRKARMREVLMYFPVGYARRFRSHPCLQAIMDAWGIDPGDRSLEYIRRSCRLTLGEFVEFILAFSMADSSRRPIYDLFFATDSPKGFIKMKEAMWEVDSSGHFRYSDADDPSQLRWVWPAEGLWPLIQQKFRGSKALVRTIYRFVNEETYYLEKHAREALRSAEERGAISVAPTKADGSKRRRRTFPEDVIIAFAKE